MSAIGNAGSNEAPGKLVIGRLEESRRTGASRQINSESLGRHQSVQEINEPDKKKKKIRKNKERK